MTQFPNIKRSYTALTQVTSRRGLVRCYPKFSISIKDGMLSVSKENDNLPAPAYNDVWVALVSLFQELGLEIPEDDMWEVGRRHTSNGGYYVYIIGEGKSIGCSPKGRFTMRRERKLPAESVLKMLLPLDAYLAEKGL